MFVGPVFNREATTAPRRARFHAIPALAVGTLLCLLWTFWQIVTGNQPLATAGSSARFGGAVFNLLAPLEMAVVTLFSALLTAAAVAQEKDRKTLLLLLLTRMTNSELVLGRLLASLLIVLLVVAASVPFFLLLMLLGGISHGQVARVLAVTVISGLAAGSLGSTVALWRDKTFQALAMTTLIMMLWLVGWEVVASGTFGSQVLGVDAAALATAMSPWQAVLAAARSDLLLTADDGTGLVAGLSPVTAFLVGSLLVVLLLNGVAIALVRVWNPSRETRASRRGDEGATIEMADDDQALAANRRALVHRAPGELREVWDNPILWREIRTWAYGKKILVIRLAYIVVALVSGFALYTLFHDDASAQAWGTSVPLPAKPLVPLMVVSVLLVNALAVTSITSERDGRSLDLLLVTDLTAKEVIFGKLGGIFYNAKEMLLLPLALGCYVWFSGYASTENLLFLIVGFLVMQLFSAVLGLHCGMTYASSRQAIAVSMGTLLFLFIGVSICMRMMVALGDRFEYQLTPFLGFIVGGGVALYAALGWRLESRALVWASGIAPLATFFIITSFLQQQYGSVFLVTLLAYGLATAAMLVPAIAEFDVATGRAGERQD